MVVFHMRRVKRVHRLAILQHDIVCDIHDVVHRADACRMQPRAQPHRRRRNLDVAHHARGIARAKLRCFHRDLHLPIDALVARAHLRSRRRERLFKRCRDLARQPEHGEAIRAVGRDLKLNNGVV